MQPGRRVVAALHMATEWGAVRVQVRVSDILVDPPSPPGLHVVRHIPVSDRGVFIFAGQNLGPKFGPSACGAAIECVDK